MLSTIIRKVRTLLHPARGVKISAVRKAEILLENKNGYRTFIETGTEFGGTIKSLRHAFEHIFSIELDQQLYEDAVMRFAGDSGITLYSGDSARVLLEILKTIDEPSLIWLDAHPPGRITRRNSPIIGELETIFAHHHHHTVVMDDARHFSFPAIWEIRWKARRAGYECRVSEGLLYLK